MLIALGVFVSDQLSKLFARMYIDAELNYGGILGLAPGRHWDVMVMAILIAVAILAVRDGRNSRVATIAWWIILGAGLGNGIDRILWGGVWDWIHYPILNVVGNLADVWLGVGVVFLAYEQIIKNLNPAR